MKVLPNLNVLETQFHNALKTLWPNAGHFPKRIGVSLSGGVDSMCLVHLLHKLNKVETIKTSIVPISFDHGLRSESAEEQSFILEEMKKLGLNNNYKSIKLDLSSIKDQLNASFENLARVKRNEQLHKVCHNLNIEHVFMGHHADDDLETFVLRLLKNSGEFGLRGIPKISQAPKLSYPFYSPYQLQVVRPLLSFRKENLYQYAKENNINWVEDSSNNEMVCKRNVIREYLKDNSKKQIELEKVHQEVIQFTSEVERKVFKLAENIVNNKLVKDKHNVFSIKIPNYELERNSDLTIARFLFKFAYVYSPMLHYHYRFTKFLEHIPYLRSNKGFTLMNLKWESKPIHISPEQGDGLEVKIKREVDSKDTPVEVKVPPNSETDWFIFDNIYWIKLINKDPYVKNYTLRKLTTKDKQFQGKYLGKSKLSQHQGLPLLQDTDTGEIYSPATFPEDHIRFMFKKNIYLPFTPFP